MPDNTEVVATRVATLTQYLKAFSQITRISYLAEERVECKFARYE